MPDWNSKLVRQLVATMKLLLCYNNMNKKKNAKKSDMNKNKKH